MRKVELGSPVDNKDIPWITNALREIEEASQEDLFDVFEDFTVSNFTATRSLDAGTATLADVANVLATIVDDIKGRNV